jgi:hypothetical protein
VVPVHGVELWADLEVPLPRQSTYSGFFDVVTKMYKNEGGLRSFLNGAESRVLWLLPFTVVHLGVYEGKSFGKAASRHLLTDMCFHCRCKEADRQDEDG